MRLAICVKSCQRDKRDGAHQAIRETWGANLPTGVDLLFFMGGDKAPADMLPDERFVLVDDGYWPSTPKMQAILKYTVWKDYDFSLLCDTDSYYDVDKLMRCGFDTVDYSGAVSFPPIGAVFGKPYPSHVSDHEKVLINPSYAYMSGGHGYFVSRNAAKIVIALKAPHQEGEDVMVGWALGPFFASGQLTAKALDSYKNVVAWHLGVGWYGGSNQGERLSPGDAVRKKHWTYKGIK